MLLRAVRFTLGLLVGMALWWYAAPSYNKVVAAMAEPLLKIDRRFSATDLTTSGRGITVKATASPVLPAATIPGDQLTYNVILLLALFASNPKPVRDTNISALAVSLLILMATHVAGLVVTIESTYAARMALWSEQHYGELAANVWLYAEMFNRLIGMFAVPFACWWWAINRR